MRVSTKLLAVITAVCALTMVPQVTAQESGGQCAGTCCKAAATEGAAGACCAAEGQKTMAKVEYKVSTLACAACEQKVTAALASIEGVNNPSACSKAKHAKLTYDPAKVKKAQLVAAIEKAGFKVDGEVLNAQVSGMKCAGCSGKVSNALTKLPGVTEQNVSHETGKVVVVFDPSKTTLEKVTAAINETGFPVAKADASSGS